MNYEERATFLINKLSNNCCNVCSCEGGIKIWCACHRKQIIETIKQIEKETAEDIKNKIYYGVSEWDEDRGGDPHRLQSDKNKILDEALEAISKHFGLEEQKCLDGRGEKCEE